MKKAFTILLVLVVIIGLCACGGTENIKGNESGNYEVSISSSNSDASTEEASSSNNVVDVSRVQTSSQEKTKSEVSSSSEDSSIKPSVTNAVHKALEESEYYQFSYMNNTEKNLYERLNASALEFKNHTDASDLNLNVKEATSVVKRFVADHPQYFWISNKVSVTYAVDSDKALECILKYSDGTVTDNLQDKMADRKKIKQKKAEVEAKAKEIISKIDSNATDYEKELQIHDYLANNLKYDKETEKQPMVNDTLKSSFDIYGALIEKKAICEGYTKSFQYLCYLVGINANQVIGNNHMWNVVKIGGDWYQVDLTWDDPQAKRADGTEVDIVRYNYFNLTTQQMSNDHTIIPDSYLKVPDCTATEYKYKK